MSNLEVIRFKALNACIAYESGFGKGVNLKDRQPPQSYTNPYIKDSFDYLCYDIGFSSGKEKSNLKEKSLLENLIDENSELKEKIKELEEMYQSELWSSKRN